MLQLLVLIAALAGVGRPDAPAPAATPAPLSTDVRAEAIKAGYPDIADRLDRAARPVLILERGSKRAGSRLGGAPELPAGARWPLCKGKPQTFLGQLRVRELPASARELRRVGGTLLFFTSVEFEPGEREYGMWAGDCTTVLHVRAGTRTQRMTRPRATLHLKTRPLRFVERRDVPDQALDSEQLMPPLADIRISNWEAWFEFRHGLLGRPQLEHTLLGYPSAPNGGLACWNRAERKRGTWRHLFTLGPDEALGFNVADAGRLQVLISPADLRAGRFDRVCGEFDSA